VADSELARRSKALLQTVGAILIDLIFLATVVVLNYLADRFVFERLHLRGSAGASLVVLNWAFSISTVVVVLAFLVRDTYVAVLTSWRSAREEVTIATEPGGR
jgi:hypothetical protein